MVFAPKKILQKILINVCVWETAHLPLSRPKTSPKARTTVSVNGRFGRGQWAVNNPKNTIRGLAKP